MTGDTRLVTYLSALGFFAAPLGDSTTCFKRRVSGFFRTQEEAEAWIKDRSAGLPACDMTKTCPFPVTHIDQDGFVYCTDHGLTRRQYQPCRKLRPHELRRLERGEQVTRY